MRSRAVLVVNLMVVAMLSACGKGDSAGDVVKIGHVAPLTGSISHIGRDNENGARLAIEDANAKGVLIDGKKVTFELVTEDDKADPDTAKTIAQKMVDGKVAGVVGHLTSATSIAAAKIYADAGIPQISGSATNPQYTAQGLKTSFRVIPNDTQQGSLMGNFIVYALQARRIAVIDDGTSYGQGLADEVQKAVQGTGAVIVARERTLSDKATDFTTVLTKIKAASPDVVFHGGQETTGAPLVKQMRELGIKSQFATGDAGCTPEFIKVAGKAADDVICSQPALPVDEMPGAHVNNFTERFEKKFGTKIQLYAPYTYDATSVLIAAMQKANSTDPAKYLPALRSINHAGITGKIEFDPKGDIKTGFVTLYKMQCGKLDVLFVQKATDLMQSLQAWRENIPMVAPCGR